MASTEAFSKNLRSILQKGLQCDSWGQRLEAANEYKTFCHEYEQGCTNFSINDESEKEIARIIYEIRSRASTLQNSEISTSSTAISREKIQKNLEIFNELVSTFENSLSKRRSSVAITCGQNLLQPKPNDKVFGSTYITIKIDKIGLKDAHTYVDPFFTISVKDKNGEDQVPVQNTPASYHVHGKHIVFDMNVHIQKSLQQLPKDFAIFFEFKHYKEKEDKVSTRCFAFIEPDELKAGHSVIELYKKPVDYDRKKLYLFTEKPLYLHLYISLTKAI